jgi:ABC-type transport system involved in cytochrome bd biosynthesis fused ATPase/permease subunit
MLPLMSPQTDDHLAGRNRPALVFAVILALLVVVGLAFVMNPALMSRALLPILLSVVVVVLPTLFVVTRSRTEKRKRSGQDMYKIIDRMVDDLDDDEIDYLQQRIEDREARGKADLSEDMVDLINLRDLDRRAGKR